MSMLFDPCKDLLVKLKLFLSWQIKNTHWQINLVDFTEYSIYWVGVGREQTFHYQEVFTSLSSHQISSLIPSQHLLSALLPPSISSTHPLSSLLPILTGISSYTFLEELLYSLESSSHILNPNRRIFYLTWRNFLSPMLEVHHLEE